MSINHLHMIVRCEGMKSTPKEADWLLALHMEVLVHNIGMKVAIPAQTKWVDTPGNEGMTAILGLETSHMAVHEWCNPDEHNRSNMDPHAKTLIQLDLYTCGELNVAQQQKILKFCNRYEPVKVVYKIINRDTSNLYMGY